MIGTVTVRVSAAHPDVPLREVPVFVGSACTVGVEGVPAWFGSVSVTGVSVAVENALGETSTVQARRSGCMWVATIQAAHFAAPGSVRNGVKVVATGVEEDGTTQTSWTLGAGDLCIISADGVPAPGESWQNVHLRDSVPASPVKGDLARHTDGWKVYTGSAWEQIGGGSVVESSVNPGYAANADYAPRAYAAETAQNATYATNAQYAFQATQSESAETVPWEGVSGVPDLATKDDLAVVMDLVGDEQVGYYITLDGAPQSFENVKAFADSRNAVIRHGRGTYRATYVGANEMMWDCTGTVQNAVQTGTIHMFAQGDVVQLVGARELAQQTELSAVAATAAYPMLAVDGGALRDRTINYWVGDGSFTFPHEGENARDFVLVVGVASTGDAPSITFPSDVTYLSDDPDVWTAEADKVNAWYFSELTGGEFMVSHKALAAVAQ